MLNMNVSVSLIYYFTSVQLLFIEIQLKLHI
jgi:hypothetical protein